MDKRRATEFLGYLLRDKNIERTIYEDALNMAIEALKAQLSCEGTTSDLISRQAAIDAIENSSKPYVWQGADIIRRLPTVQPEPHEGHWIEVAGELECSECHTVFTDLYPDYADSVACPHCGTKMTISK